jgi:hypothetical protein
MRRGCRSVHLSATVKSSNSQAGMPDPAPRLSSPLTLLARASAGMSRGVRVGLVLLSIPLWVSLTGVVADALAERNESASDGVRPFRLKQVSAAAPSCVGQACGLATLPLHRGKQLGGASSTRVTARLMWPAPLLFDASPGTYLQAVGASDAAHPVAERPSPPEADDPAGLDSLPVLLAEEVLPDGHRRPVTVKTEGFVSGWITEDDGAETWTLWQRPLEPKYGDARRAAEIERNRDWQALKLRRLQFQPVPPEVDVEISRDAVIAPIPVGHVMVFDWRADGALQDRQSQLVPSRNGVGVVTQAQEVGQTLRLKVQIPRSSPYGSGHWLWHRLDGAGQDAQPLPRQVQALFFAPAAPVGSHAEWGDLEQAFFNLPEGEAMRAPAAALDPGCADKATPQQSCVWAVLQGVAVPVQVHTQALPGGEVLLTERAVFAGKALRAADWARLPQALRRSYGQPASVAPQVSRPLLDAQVQRLLIPVPWLKTGQAVGITAATPGVAS